MKRCTDCKKTEKQTNFRDGYRHCEPCRSVRNLKSASGTPESFLKRALTIAKSRAKNKTKVPKVFDIDLPYIMGLWKKQEGRCALSGVHMTYIRGHGANVEMNVSIDRIDSSLGYVEGNIQLVTSRVNSIKGDLDNASFDWWMRTIHDYTCKQ